MSEIITIFQDYKQNISKYRDHFPVIEEFKPTFGDQNLILQTDGSIQVSHYVGYIQKGKTCIQILPKIYSGKKLESHEIEDSLAFLFRLLRWSGFLNFKDFNELDISHHENTILEIFIEIFIRNFLFEFNRAPHFEYVKEIENQQFIKGKILFPQTIKQNSYYLHQHVIEFDDFSVNNKLNQLFKYVINELLHLTVNSKNRSQLKQGYTLLEEVDHKIVSLDWFNNIQFTRQNIRYQTLFNFAKLFFFNNHPGVSAGKENTFSFLVPLNLLFESVVKDFLEQVINTTARSMLKYQSRKFFGKEGEKNKFPLQPDFIVINKTNGETEAILDTKFKNPFNQENEASISESDLYQLTTYASAHDCNQLFLIYPHFFNTPSLGYITSYELYTRGKITTLHLIQVDITKESRADIIEQLHNSLKLKVHNL